MGAFSSKVRPSKSKQFDPDEKWSNLYREREKNSIYRWVGSRHVPGDLLNIYEKDGEDGILKFADEKIAPLLFDEGKNGPQEIKLVDYQKWRKQLNLELGVSEMDTTHTFEARFLEHKALWRLNKRGVDGENVIHMLLTREHPACHEIARILIRKYPGLSHDVFLGNEMFGQSALHLAIVHDDYETVQLLLKSGANVNSRAIGDFFLPEDWKMTRKITDYEGWAYYGEYPLAFAACFGNKDIYDLLIDNGADPNLRDFFGNTILHMCVISNSSSMYSYAVRHWTTPADPDIVNEAGYTPLTLATKLGRKKIFDEMLELSKVEFYRFSDMACSAYPLNTLDTIRHDGSTNYDSALMTVIDGTSDEHLDMINSEVIERLLADKWSAFAKVGLYKRMAVVILQLICFSIAVGLRPTELDRLYYDMPKKVDPNAMVTTTTTTMAPINSTIKDMYHPPAYGPHTDDWFRLFFEIITYAVTLYYAYQQAMEIRAQGTWSYVRNMWTTPAKVIYTISSIMIMLCLPLRIFRQYEYEECLLAFALPGSFIYGLFFARSFKLTGPFVQMIYSMIAGDLALFAIIFAIFVTPFSFVMHFLGADIEAKQDLDKDANEFACTVTGYTIFTFNGWLETFMTMFRAAMKGYDYEELGCANYTFFMKVLFVLWMFIMPIMMINVLIAMMGNTYLTVIIKAEKAWKRQYAQIVMNLERSLNPHTLVNHMFNYSIKLQDGTVDGDDELRGLMVIKKTHKTKAGSRRNAVLNWKRIGRRVIETVYRMGVDEARKVLHGHGKYEALITEEDKKDFRPITRYNRPTTVWRHGAAEVAHMDEDDRPESSRPMTTTQMQRAILTLTAQRRASASPKIQSGVTTPTDVTIVQAPRMPKVRGSVMFPSLDLPNMPGGSALTLRPTRVNLNNPD